MISSKNMQRRLQDLNLSTSSSSLHDHLSKHGLPFCGIPLKKRKNRTRLDYSFHDNTIFFYSEMHSKNWCALWTVCLALGLVYNSAIRVLTCANSCTLYFTHLALGELQYIFPSVLNLGKEKEYAYGSKTETISLALKNK